MIGRQMRVVQIGPVPPPHGGVAMNMLAIHEKLRQLGHRSTLIDVTNRTGAPAGDDVLKPRSALGLVRMLVGTKADIVHYHIGGDFNLRLSLLTLFCGLLPKRRAVVTFHSGGYAKGALNTAKPFSIRGLAFRSIDLLIGVNDEMVAMFKAFGVEESRIRSILPFELKKPDPLVRLPDDLASFAVTREPFLLAVGALEEEYRNEFLIDSMPALLEKFPNAGLIIVGAGSLGGRLERLLRSRGLEGRVLITGNLEHPVVLHLIDRANCLLRITDYDGDSIAVREALFLGTPVVASDNVQRPRGVELLPAPFKPHRLVQSVTKALKGQFSGHSDAAQGGNAIKVVEAYQELLER